MLFIEIMYLHIYPKLVRVKPGYIFHHGYRQVAIEHAWSGKDTLDHFKARVEKKH